MTPFIAWGEATLIASAALMLFVLAVRNPVRRFIGPQLGYALWALPALRLLVPSLPVTMLGAMSSALRTDAQMPFLLIGPHVALGGWRGAELPSLSDTLLAIWLVGVIGFFTIYAARHFVFCRALRASSTDFGRFGVIRIIAANVEAPLAFGVFRRFIAVPHAFPHLFDAGERDLALAHERAHHARGDLIANWASLIVLAVHWWNPVAWVAIRAFREDQEFAADAHVLAGREPGALPIYANVLAKAAGIGALPACNLTPRSNLKGRLMMLGKNQRSNLRLAIGRAALLVLGGTALAATATASGTSGLGGKQAVTIGVKPDGSDGYALIIGKAVVAPGAALPGGMTLPADFSGPGGCDLKPAAKPFAMVIKGIGGTKTYTVICASAAPAPVRGTLAEELASLNTMRASVATQQATPAFPEAERAHALNAIDRSIREVEATLAAIR